MKLPEAIDAIEGCTDLPALRRVLQVVAENYGFASYAYLDTSGTEEGDLLVIATTHDQWGEDYRRYHFVSFDPVLAAVRRSNGPYTWGQVRYPLMIGRKKSGAARLMEAALDHGFTEGLAIPLHRLDGAGRYTTAVCGFFWRDRRLGFGRRVDERVRGELHLILVYWAQTLSKVLRSRAAESGLDATVATLPVVTDRERTILTLAARGKTALETAAALTISAETVEFHLRNAARKLSSSNKTEAAVRALKLGLIDI